MRAQLQTKRKDERGRGEHGGHIANSEVVSISELAVVFCPQLYAVVPGMVKITPTQDGARTAFRDGFPKTNGTPATPPRDRPACEAASCAAGEESLHELQQ
jgi:hypothetical protein